MAQGHEWSVAYNRIKGVRIVEPYATPVEGVKEKKESFYKRYKNKIDVIGWIMALFFPIIFVIMLSFAIPVDLNHMNIFSLYIGILYVPIIGFCYYLYAFCWIVFKLIE